MKSLKRLLVSSIILALLLVACDLPDTATPTEPGPGTDTPTATTNPPPTKEASPTATATVPYTPTPSVTPIPVYTERLDNPDFEGNFDYWLQYGGFVGEAWYPVIWRGFPIPRVCEGEILPGCNPPGLGTRNPEYKPAESWHDAIRVFNGQRAQQFFCSGEHCFAGVAQNIQTAPGEPCIVSGFAQTWGAASGRSNVSNTLYRSDYASEDDRDNMHVLVVVNPQGGGIEFPFPDYYEVADYGYADGIYDEPAGGSPVGFEFTAQDENTTIAFIGYQLYPVGNANWYIDYTSVWCAGGEPAAPVVDLTATPTPIVPVEIPYGDDGLVYNVEAQSISNVSFLEGFQMDFDITLEVVFKFLAFVPLLGGVLGALNSGLVDLVKAVLHAFGKELPEEWAGRAVLIINVVMFGVIYFVTKTNPVDYVLPGEVENLLGAVISLISAVVALMVAIPFAKLQHYLSGLLAPTAVSATARANQGNA